MRFTSIVQSTEKALFHFLERNVFHLSVKRLISRRLITSRSLLNLWTKIKYPPVPGFDNYVYIFFLLKGIFRIHQISEWNQSVRAGDNN